MTSKPITSEGVKKFYENNTRRFLKWGKDGGTRNIHQPLWTEGVHDFEEAISRSNEMMLEELEVTASELKSEVTQVLDLGCGVGSTLFYVAERFSRSAMFTGVTISPTQVAIASRHASISGKADSCRFIQADFTRLPELERVDMAYAIEAFLHAPDAEAFFNGAGRLLKPGGKLVILDDVLSDSGAIEDQNQLKRQCLKDFREGWMAGSLLTYQEISQFARSAGLTPGRNDNMTSFMRIGRPRDKFIGLMIQFFGNWMRRSTYMRSFTGGYAKQTCLKNGWVEYRFMVFEKPTE